MARGAARRRLASAGDMAHAAATDLADADLGSVHFSSAAGEGLVSACAGTACSFRVTVRDKFGRPCRREDSVVLVRVLTGGEGGDCCEAHVKFFGQGVYVVTYEPKQLPTGGPNRTIQLHVLVNGAPLADSPFFPKLSAGIICPEQCTVTGANLYETLAGHMCKLTIILRDTYSNMHPSGGGKFTLHARGRRAANAEHARHFEELEILSESEADASGTHVLRWTPEIPGIYELRITLDRIAVKGSPFACTVSSPFAYPAATCTWTQLDAPETTNRPDAAAMARVAAGTGEGSGAPEATAAAGGGGGALAPGRVPSRGISIAASANSGGGTRRVGESRALDGSSAGASDLGLADHSICIHKKFVSCAVDGQLLVVADATTPGGLPLTSLHLCQFEVQYSRDTEYLVEGSLPPPCRWRAAKLKVRADLQAPAKMEQKHIVAESTPTSPRLLSPRPLSPRETAAALAHDVAIDDSARLVAAENSRCYLLHRCLTSRSIGGLIDRQIFGVSFTEVIGGSQSMPSESLTRLDAGAAKAAPSFKLGFCAAALAPLRHGQQRQGRQQEHDRGVAGQAVVDSYGGDTIWLFGGESDGGFSSELWMFSAERPAWKLIGEASQRTPYGEAGRDSGPSARSFAAMSADDKRGLLWLAHGKTSTSSCSRELWTCQVGGAQVGSEQASSGSDSAAVTWTQPCTRGQRPIARHSHTSTLLRTGYMVLCGGVDESGNFVDDLGLLDTESLTWHLRTPQPPLRRSLHCAGTASDKLVVLGGQIERQNATSFRDAAIPEGEVMLSLAPMSLDLICESFVHRASIEFVSGSTGCARAVAPPSLTQSLSNGFSVEAWVCPTVFGDLAPILSVANTALTQGFGMMLARGDADDVGWLVGFVGNPRNCAKFKLTSGKLVHVALTWEQMTLEKGLLCLYKGGKFMESAELLVTEKQLSFSSSIDLVMGCSTDGTSWQGELEEVRLWGKPLSADDVSAGLDAATAAARLPPAGAPAWRVRSSKLLGAWTFNEGAGKLCIDSSGRGHHCELEGDGARRVQSKHRRVLPSMEVGEEQLNERKAKLDKWRKRFERVRRRTPESADYLMAEKSVLDLAKSFNLC